MNTDQNSCLIRVHQCLSVVLFRALLTGSKSEVAAWMTENSVTLGNQVPLELLDTTVGFEIVFNELKRIQYGIAG